MSILIKGMEMPKACFFCECCESENYWCRAAKRDIGADPYNSVADFCPLVELPPHGRLIDADTLMKEFEKAENTMAEHGRAYTCSFMSRGEISTAWYCVEDMLDNAPTIIEAEGEGDG